MGYCQNCLQHQDDGQVRRTTEYQQQMWLEGTQFTLRQIKLFPIFLFFLSPLAGVTFPGSGQSSCCCVLLCVAAVCLITSSRACISLAVAIARGRKGCLTTLPATARLLNPICVPRHCNAARLTLPTPPRPDSLCLPCHARLVPTPPRHDSLCLPRHARLVPPWPTLDRIDALTPAV